MYLDICLEPLDFGRRGWKRAFRRARNSKLEGDAVMCGGPGGEQRFTFTGNNEDDKASRIYVGLAVADSAPPDGVAPSHLRGRWNGRDSLALEADVHLRRGTAAITSTDDPDTGRPASLGMHRDTESEFRAVRAAARIGVRLIGGRA